MIGRKLRCFFIGNVKTSAIALSTLLANPKIEMVGILTTRQSKFNADFTDISIIAKSFKVAVHFYEDTNDLEKINILREANIDVCFTIGWSRLIPSSFLTIPKLGTIGFHPSELPKNRGRHPLIWALVLGLKETASSFFLIEEGADTGPILSQVPISIEVNDDAGTLYEKILKVMVDQINELVHQFYIGKVMPKNQKHHLSNYWRKRSYLDGRIDWRMSAKNIHNLVRGLTRPYLGAEFIYDGNTIKVWKTEMVVDKVPDNLEPGKVLEVSVDGIIVKAGEDAIRLVKFEPQLKIEMGDYL